jgi:hypothetical protein
MGVQSNSENNLSPKGSQISDLRSFEVLNKIPMRSPKEIPREISIELPRHARGGLKFLPKF